VIIHRRGSALVVWQHDFGDEHFLRIRDIFVSKLPEKMSGIDPSSLTALQRLMEEHERDAR
jgi:hypothetical protein